MSVPVQTTCTGAGRLDLLPTGTYDDRRTLRTVLFIISFLMRISRNILYLCIQKFCSADGEKICSVNLDQEITFLTLGRAGHLKSKHSKVRHWHGKMGRAGQGRMWGWAG